MIRLLIRRQWHGVSFSSVNEARYAKQALVEHGVPSNQILIFISNKRVA